YLSTRSYLYLLSFLNTLLPPTSTLFPYTTLFRSLENEKTVTQFCRKLAAERPLKDIRDEYNYPKKKGIKDECSRLLEASSNLEHSSLIPDRKSGSAGMPRPISYAVFCLKKKKTRSTGDASHLECTAATHVTMKY